MTVKRLLVSTFLAAGLTGAGAALRPAQARDWACAGVKAVDFGVCIGNPVPSDPPDLPDRPGPHPLLPL